MPNLKTSKNDSDLVRVYLGEIGRIPLLTPEQEIYYGKQVQQMMSLLAAKEALTQKLRREPSKPEWAAQVEKQVFEIDNILQQGQRAKQKMVKANLRFVIAIAKKYQKRGLELLDLIQEGTIGLERGVEKFEPSKGYKLSTYIYHWIKQGITRAIAQDSRTIRLPIHFTDKLNKIKKTQRQLSQHLGRTPTTAELAAELKLTPQQVREYLEKAQQPISLNLLVGRDQDIELGELLEDTSASPEDYLLQTVTSMQVEQLISNLTSQQREVLSLRFGLVDGQPLTLVKTAGRLYLSRERVRQVEKEALEKLRQLLAAQQGEISLSLVAQSVLRI